MRYKIQCVKGVKSWAINEFQIQSSSKMDNRLSGGGVKSLFRIMKQVIIIIIIIAIFTKRVPSFSQYTLLIASNLK